MPELSLGWSRNGGTLGRNGTESSPERAEGTMARMLARIPVHFVFSTTEPGAPARAPLQGWPLGSGNPGFRFASPWAMIRAAPRAL